MTTLFDQIPPSDPNVKKGDEARLKGQNALVLDLLKRGPVKESDVYPRVKRLAARIHDLREQGFKIKTVTQEPVAVYELEDAA